MLLDSVAMNTIRGWLFYIVLSTTLVPLVLLAILLYPAPLTWRYAVGRSWARLMLECGRVICGMRYEVKGMENFPAADEPVLVLSKHQSAWEIFWLMSYVPHQVSFVYKKELHYVPVFGQALATMKMMAIDRKKGANAYSQFVRQGRRFLKNGWWILMFPEGTRTAPGAKTTYKTGGARFAALTGTRIVPVALNSGECWPRNSIAKKPGLITVSVGPAILSEGRTYEEIQNDLVTWIESEMKNISPTLYGQKDS